MYKRDGDEPNIVDCQGLHSDIRKLFCPGRHRYILHWGFFFVAGYIGQNFPIDMLPHVRLPPGHPRTGIHQGPHLHPRYILHRVFFFVAGYIGNFNIGQKFLIDMLPHVWLPPGLPRTGIHQGPHLHPPALFTEVHGKLYIKIPPITIENSYKRQELNQKEFSN